MKENTLLLLLIMFGSFSLCSAQSFGQDVVTQNDGKVLTGKLIKYSPGEYLKMELNSGELVELEDSTLAKIEQGRLGILDPNEANQSETPIARKKGFYGNSMLSFAVGSSSSDGLSLGAGFSQVIGYQFKPHLGFGFGFGVDNYSKRGETVYPIFLEARSFFPSKKTHAGFYALAGSGYSLALPRESLNINEAKGGIMGQFSLGYRSATIEGIDVNFDLGFKFQKAEFHRTLYNGDIEQRKINFQRLVFRVGIGLWKS